MRNNFRRNSGSGLTAIFMIIFTFLVFLGWGLNIVDLFAIAGDRIPACSSSAASAFSSFRSAPSSATSDLEFLP